MYAELRATGQFVTATRAVDEAEHSLEACAHAARRAQAPPPDATRAQMHLPYLVKCFAGRPFTLVRPRNAQQATAALTTARLS